MSAGPVTPRAASIRDVARLAGVSHQTVSRVLNDQQNILPGTRARVLAAMAELQYRPSAAARALSTKRTRTIGVLASGRAHYGSALSIQALEQAARERGYSVTSSSVGEPDEQSLRAALVNLIGQDIEALVVIAPQRLVFDAIADLAPTIPCITMRATGTGDASALHIDEVTGARLATRHLLLLGHAEIGHISGPPGWVESEGRLQNRLAPYLVAAGREAAATGTPVMRAMVLAFPDDPTARTLDRQYLLGPDLLVAPVFTAEGDVELYLPAGTWTSLLTGEQVTGPGWRLERHGFDSLPLYVRGGAVLPLGEREDRPDTDHLDGLTLRAFPDGTGRRTVPVADAVFEVETTADAVRASGPAGRWSLQVGSTVVASRHGVAVVAVE